MDNKPNFISDKEKMNDFFKLTKEEFLFSYSYLTEEEYDNTMEIASEEAMMAPDQFEIVKAMLRYMEHDGWDITYRLACIYDLFMDYLISIKQEEELYNFVDPEEKYNDVSKYYYDDEFCRNPLKEILGYAKEVNV